MQKEHETRGSESCAVPAVVPRGKFTRFRSTVHKSVKTTWTQLRICYSVGQQVSTKTEAALAGKSRSYREELRMLQNPPRTASASSSPCESGDLQCAEKELI